ncbi:hypothetical protein PMAYCL1PPCAC_10856, partial [Pristionchus mayeri]
THNPSSIQLYDIIGRMRRNVLHSWTEFKGALEEAGVGADLRVLWSRMSGVVEPYAERMSRRIGKALGDVLKEDKKQ